MTMTKNSSSNSNAERARRIQSMAGEARTIVKDMRVASACTRLVELFEPTASHSTTMQWQSIKKTPSYQYQAQQSVLYTLKQRTHQLQQTIRAMSHEKDGSHSLAATAKV
jgi:dynactin 1